MAGEKLDRVTVVVPTWNRGSSIIATAAVLADVVPGTKVAGIPAREVGSR